MEVMLSGWPGWDIDHKELRYAGCVYLAYFLFAPMFFIFRKQRRIACLLCHNSVVRMNAMVSQITGVSTACSADCSGADQRKRQSSASLAFVMGIHRWPVDSPHKRPVTRKLLPLDDAVHTTNHKQLKGIKSLLPTTARFNLTKIHYSLMPLQQRQIHQTQPRRRWHRAQSTSMLISRGLYYTRQLRT